MITKTAIYDLSLYTEFYNFLDQNKPSVYKKLHILQTNDAAVVMLKSFSFIVIRVLVLL